MQSKFLSTCMELFSVVFLLLILYPLLNYGALEGIPVPMHFDNRGNVDSWSSRENLFLISAIGFVIYGILSACQRYPGLVNLPKTGSLVTPEQRNQTTRFSALLLKAWSMVLFAFISISTYRIAIGEEQKLNVIFLAGILLCLLAAIAVSLMNFKKIPKSES